MLLRKMATTRTATEPIAVRYDPNLKITHVRTPGDRAWTPSYDSAHVSDTKKADMETGEDQKGQ